MEIKLINFTPTAEVKISASGNFEPMSKDLPVSLKVNQKYDLEVKLGVGIYIIMVSDKGGCVPSSNTFYIKPDSASFKDKKDEILSYYRSRKLELEGELETRNEDLAQISKNRKTGKIMAFITAAIGVSIPIVKQFEKNSDYPPIAGGAVTISGLASGAFIKNEPEYQKLLSEKTDTERKLSCIKQLILNVENSLGIKNIHKNSPSDAYELINQFHEIHAVTDISDETLLRCKLN